MLQEHRHGSTAFLQLTGAGLKLLQQSAASKANISLDHALSNNKFQCSRSMPYVREQRSTFPPEGHPLTSNAHRKHPRLLPQDRVPKPSVAPLAYLAVRKDTSGTTWIFKIISVRL